MSHWSKEELQEALTKLREKAATDEKFRELCNKDVHAAIQEVTGKVFPSTIKISVVDMTGYHVGVTLPPLATKEGELSENELGSVAGGTGIEGGFGGDLSTMPVSPGEKSGRSFDDLINKKDNGNTILPYNPSDTTER